jgi:geranylgeranyl diphosphate synthase type II
MLESYRRAALETLLAYLPSKEPRRHLYNLVPDYPLRGGKGFRPAICIATCRAFGGATEEVLRSAAAIELFHNAFLVHDDVEDGSDYRRGLPTLHVLHGIPVAVNVGDAMNALGIKPLMDNRDLLGWRLTWEILVEIERMVRQSVEGQAMEIGWVHDNVCDVTYDDYLRMTLKKTCWYTCITPLRVGALIGSKGTAEIDALNQYGFYMGAAFQIQDDLLNLVGEHERYGKEIAGDIREGKRTLMLIHLYGQLDEGERRRLETFLATPRPDRDEEDVAWVLEGMHARGSIEFARSQSRRLAGGALHEFGRAIAPLPDSPDKRFLGELVTYMVERDL